MNQLPLCAHNPKTSICKICNQEFTQPKRRTNKTCSKECARLASILGQSTKITYACQGCGSEFVDKKGRNRKFCSRPCADKGRVQIPTQFGIRPCKHCGTPFDVPITFKDASKQRFCSLQCYGKYRRKTNSPSTCKNCGQEFYVIPSQKARPYCSPDCYIEYKTSHYPCYTGNVNLYGLNWFEQREARRLLDSYQCQNCGVREKDLDIQLHVHHVIPFRAFGIENYQKANQLGNLVSLCSDCHKRLEHNPVKSLALCLRNIC